MNVIKPKTLGLLTRLFEAGGRRHLAVTALSFFEIGAPETLLPDTAMWAYVADALGGGAPLDTGMPKQRGEVLVHGAVQAAGGVPAKAVAVGLRIASVDKRLRVYGNRQWLLSAEGGHAVVSEPAPFSDMPMTFARAFGGEGFERNPDGLGHGAERLIAERRPAPLPNIEAWDEPVVLPRDVRDPAGLGPVDIRLPQRMVKAGTYDRAWLENRFPGWADDVDWTLFNEAAPDQWIDGFFRGDEPFSIVGMNAATPRLEGRLPGVAARVFVERADGDGTRLGELATRLDTVWLFPNDRKAVLAHRAVARDVTHPDGEDVTVVMLARERLGEPPRPPAYYADVLGLRTDPATRALYVLADGQLTPDPTPEEAARRAAEATAARTEAEADHRERFAHFTTSALARAGITLPATALPPPPPLPAVPVVTSAQIERGDADIAGLVATLERMLEEATASAETVKAEALAAAETAKTDALAAREESGLPAPSAGGGAGGAGEIAAAKEKARARAVDPLPADGMDADFDPTGLLDDIEGDAPPPTAAPSGPLDMLDDTERARLAASDGGPGLDALLAGLSAEAGAAAPVDRDGVAARLLDARTRMRDGMHQARRFSPERMAPQEPMADEVGAFLGTLILDELAGGRSFAGRDLAGADLRGADLSGRDFRGTLFDGADLRGARLSGADCRDAVFTGARLAGADLSGAMLAGANLSAADLAGADLSRCDLTGAQLSKASLVGANLAGAVLDEVMALEADLSDAELSFCRARRTMLVRADLSRSRAFAARLDECVLIEARLADADFLGATLTGCVLVSVGADGMRLSGARLGRMVATGAASFRGLSGVAVRASGSGWRGACLASADLTGARFDGADLGKTDLTGAIAPGASFVKAVLSGATAAGAELTGASLREALLRATVLDHAVLRAACLQGADVTGASFQGADLSGADARGTALQR